MTDLLIRDEPHDTGEIPAVDPGTTTLNLAPYAVLPPAMRRPTVEVPALDLGDCRATLTGELVPAGHFQAPNDPRIPYPDPLPPPPPPTPGYVARHRAPARWYTPVVEAYAAVYARLRGVR